LVREKYGGPVGERFGPTLAAEHLASEDGLQLDAETLRRWMPAEGLWSRERKRRAHRRRRERKEHFGELVQMDGSFHAWLEGRGPEGCLIDMVDDGTNTTWAQLGEQETLWAVADALRSWIERYGVPLALYVDWKKLYKRPANSGERLRGEEPITQFWAHVCEVADRSHRRQFAAGQGAGRACSQHASGPAGEEIAAEGHPQSRSSQCVSGAGIFGRTQPALHESGCQAENYHRRAPRAAELERIFRLESERIISQDWVVRYDNRFFQLQPQSHNYAPAQSKVLVCEGRHGSITIEYRGEALRWQEVPAPARPHILSVPRERVLAESIKRKWTPPGNHPWREAARRGLEQRERRTSRGTARAPRPSLALPSASS
jgi:hypothetical protein